MFATLRAIDLVVQEEEGPVALQTDHRTSADIDASWGVSVALASARVVNPGRFAGLDRVRFVLLEPPGERYRELVRAMGAEVAHGLDGERWPAAPDPARVAREVDAALRALGRRVLADRRPGTGRAAAEALQASYASGLDRTQNDGEAWWTAVIELAAAIGELLAAERPGRWVPDEGRSTVIPWLWGTEAGALNVLGRVLRFFEEGASQRPSELWSLLEETDVHAGRLLVRLQPAEADTTAPELARPLLPGAPGAPCWSFVRDRPRTVSVLGGPEGPEREAWWAEAMAGLAGIEVAVVERAGPPRVLVVHGDEYAAEKLLDPAFLRGLAARLGARGLWCAVPSRGALWVTAEGSGFDLDAFSAVVGRLYEAADLPLRLTPAVLRVEDGRVVAVARGGGPATA